MSDGLIATKIHTFDTLPEWLWNVCEAVRSSAYGEAERVIVIVDTDERLKVLQYGCDTDNQTLKLINEGRGLVKAKAYEDV